MGIDTMSVVWIEISQVIDHVNLVDKTGSDEGH